MPGLEFSVLVDRYAVVRMRANEVPPAWALASRGFISITRSAEELSIVCREQDIPAVILPDVPADVPAEVRVELGWSLMTLHGPFDFAQSGVLASFADPLAAAGVGIFAISTFDTDFMLVKASQLEAALTALAGAGHLRTGEQS